MNYLIYSAFFLILFGCSFKNSFLKNQKEKGHEQLYSEPEAPKVVKNYKRVVIAATNDLHGQLGIKQIDLKSGESIQIGGAGAIHSYFSILRNTYEHVLFVDSGDILPKDSLQAPLIGEFYSNMNYDALTLGIRDFGIKLPTAKAKPVEFLKSFIETSKTPFLIGNLHDLKTGQSVNWPGVTPSLLKEINGVKIGIIGLIPDDLVELTPIDKRVGLFVESILPATLRNARLLKSQGAEAIIVMINQGLECGNEMAQKLKLPVKKVNFDPRENNACDLQGPLAEYLKRLPPDLVDVVITGRSENKTANFLGNTLLLSGFGDGMSFTYAELFFDPVSKKLLKDKVIAHQPVMFCREFFKETNDCFFEDPTVDHKSKIPAKFLGEIIKSNDELDTKFNSLSESSSVVKINEQEILKMHEADLIYKNEDTGTHLAIIEVSGNQLSDILEEEYNQGTSTQWKPYPFSRKNDELRLFVNGERIKSEKNYKILTELGNLQTHLKLKSLITNISTKSLETFAWDTEPSDEVMTTLASENQIQ